MNSDWSDPTRQESFAALLNDDGYRMDNTSPSLLIADVDAVISCESLTLNDIPLDDPFSSLTLTVQLEEPNLNHGAAAPEQLQSLSSYPKLDEPNLDHAAVAPEQLQSLSSYPKLEEPNLDYAAVAPEQLQSLSSYPQLEEPNLGHGVAPVSPAVSDTSSSSSGGGDETGGVRRKRQSKCYYSTLTEAEKYQRIRAQNNKASRSYRQRRSQLQQNLEVEERQESARNRELREQLQNLQLLRDQLHKLSVHNNEHNLQQDKTKPT